ncbi:MAG: HEAT repeat domain-containing protein [Deltaproteobacteria bacterium]|nr:HEAT repeat domain-containing protein [Deltaproteobacteria bacterium]
MNCPMGPRRRWVAVPVLALFLAGTTLILPAGTGVATAAERAEPRLYVLELVDLAGVPVRMIVPTANRTLSDAGLSTRPTKAFEALRARSPKEYGVTSLRLDSATKATLVLDKVADADHVLAEVFWSLASLGYAELSAPPYIKDMVTLDRLAYGAAVTVLPLWDAARFHDQPGAVGQAFVVLGGVPVAAPEAIKRLLKADPAARKALTDAVAGSAVRPKMAVLELITDARLRDALKLKADDAAPALADASLNVRQLALDAVIAAGFANNKVVLAALENLVETDSDGELKLRAVKALSKAGVTKYSDLLETEKLKTGTAREAMEAVAKLSKSQQVKIAGPALVGALSHSDKGVRDAALRALTEMAQYDLLHGALKGDMLSAEMREQIATLLVENGTPAAQDDALLYLITKGKAVGAILACQTYGKRGAKTATPVLIEALKHDSAEVRGAAAEALAMLKDDRAIPPLADAADAKARDKEMMLKAATEILAALSIDKVKNLTDAKNVTVRQMAIRALAEFAKGSRPRPDVVAILQEKKKDPDINIKRSAVFALARLQDDGIARDLADMRKDPDVEVRIQVATALTNASDKYAEAAQLLEEMMGDGDRKVRIEAIRGLGKRKAAGVVAKLVAFTKQPDVEVKRAVFEALVLLRSPENAKELRPVFQKGMETQDSAVRLSCITALADKTTAADIEGLRQAAFDNNKQVKLAAVAALGASKLVEAMDALANFFGDPDNEVRKQALEALCGVPAGESASVKKRYLKDFIDTGDMPDDLKARAKQCQAAP